MKKLLLTLLVVLTCSRGFQVNKRFNIHAISALAFNVVEKEPSDAALKTACAALTHKAASKHFDWLYFYQNDYAALATA